jgi:hypothetical protein
MDGPNYPTPTYTNEEIAKLKKYGGRFVLIDAQTAHYFDPEDTSPDRSHAKYKTWDEVK